MKNSSLKISLPKTVRFTEPTILHPKNSKTLTVAALAKILERKYDLLHKFVRMHKKDITGVIIKNVKRSWKYGKEQEEVNSVIADEIKNMFRMYILREEHGIKTKASRVRGSQSFIDTGAYFSSFFIIVDKSKIQVGM